MTNNTATLTRTAPATVAAAATTAPRTAATLSTPPACTVEELRLSVAASEASATYASADAAALNERVLSRYAYHASRFTRTHDGVVILPESDRATVATLVWLDATNTGKAPQGADKTATTTSIGQYVSKFGTVATDLAYGAAFLSDTVSVIDAYKSIAEAKAAAKARAADTAAAAASVLAENDLAAWLTLAPVQVREAFKLVEKALTTAQARQFAEAFSARLVAANGTPAAI